MITHMTNAIVLVCFLLILAVISLYSRFRSQSRHVDDANGLLRFRIDTLQQQLKNSESRISRIEEKTNAAPAVADGAKTDNGESKTPLTVDSVRRALRENGFRPEGPDTDAGDRQLVVFNIENTRFHVDVTRLPFITLELGYSMDPLKEDIDLLYRAAYEVTAGVFVGKAVILGEGQAVVFQAEMMCDSYTHLKDNFRRYLDIVIETHRRFYDTYQKMKEEKKRAVEDIMNSAFNANGKENGERRNLS